MTQKLSKEATAILNKLGNSLRELSAEETWHKLTQTELTKEVPFEVHLELYEYIYQEYQRDTNPAPVCFPSKNTVEASNLKSCMRYLGIPKYADFHKYSITEFHKFWELSIKRVGIEFIEPYSQIYRQRRSVEEHEWLPGAKLNIVDSCFKGDLDAPAIYYQNFQDRIVQLTYRELLYEVDLVAASLAFMDIAPGTHIAIDMLMSKDAVAIYLGIIKAGCVAVGIADSFAISEIASRLKISGAKYAFVHDVIERAGKIHPMYSKIRETGQVTAIVVPVNEKFIQVDLEGDDLSYHDFLHTQDLEERDKMKFDSEASSAHTHITILFSSGTTQEPKAIPWDHASAIKAAIDGYFHQDIHHKDIVAWPTSLGWMMGPWLIFASLINGAAIAMSRHAPMTKEFLSFIAKSHVSILGTVPSIVRYWRDKSLLDNVDLSYIRLITSTAESSNFNDMLWLMAKTDYKPIIEYCGGTEVSGGYITSTVIQPNIPSTFSTKALGTDFVIIDEQGNECDKGEVALIPPALGLSRELLNRDHHEVYFAGMPMLKDRKLRRHGDEMQRLANGYFRSLGRVDDTMKLGGIKISSAEIEKILMPIDFVDEVAAVGHFKDGPTELIIFVVVREHFKDRLSRKDILPIMQDKIKELLNPLFKISEVIIVDSLPRTSSNKIMRRTLRDQLIN